MPAISVEKPEGKSSLGRCMKNVRIILKCILKETE
jgi:hypothetical protein